MFVYFCLICFSESEPPWMLQFCELCCPCGLHCVISGLLAGGSPGFRSVLCWFPFSQSSGMALLWLLPVLFCLVWPPFQSWEWHYGWYNAITFLLVTDVTNWPADHPAFFVLFVLFWLFGFCVVLLWLVFCFGSASCLCFFLLASWQQIGLCTGPSSVHFWSPPSWRWMTFFALINRICQFASGLQAWWTTWRELWGVGRKKSESEPPCLFFLSKDT